MINKDPERFTLFIAALTGWLNARRQQSFTQEQVATCLKACLEWSRRAAPADRPRQTEDA